MAEAGKIHSPPAGRQKERPDQSLSVIGTRMLRKEDPRFLIGRGRFVDDVALPNMAHAAVLRSPHAHARIKSIDKRAALALPGVAAVITGEEAAQETGPLPCFASPPVEQRCIAHGKVRHVGEPVALVVADSRYIAEDAVALIKVEYEPLPAVSDMMEAINSRGEAVLHPERGPDNIAEHRNYVFGPVEEEFARAAHVVKRHLRWARSGGQPIETCGAVASFDEASEKFTIYVNSSMYNYIGFTVAAALKVASHQVNLVPLDAGGSFGSKLFLHKVAVLAGLAARAAGRPVKYIEDRIDNITACDNHGSDRTYDVELALDSNHLMTALRYKVVDDYGAYFQYGLGTHGNGFSQTVGPYKIRAVGAEIYAVFTNKCQQGACRGFGSEVTNFMIERIVDAAVDELNLDPIAFRRDNFIQPEEFPYQIPTGNLYDSGNYPGALDMALQMLDYDGWREKQQLMRTHGRYVGIGVASCQEKGVFSATEFWMLNRVPGFALTSSPERLGQDRRDRQGCHLVTRAVLGQQPGDGRRHGARRAAHNGSGRHQRNLFGYRSWTSRHRAGRQPLHRDDCRGRDRRGRDHQREAQARGRPHARGGAARLGVSRRQDRRKGRFRSASLDRRGGDPVAFLPAVAAGRS
jgi:CO/xanthine dehydrogenase Mo-binding subunit